MVERFSVSAFQGHVGHFTTVIKVYNYLIINKLYIENRADTPLITPAETLKRETLLYCYFLLEAEDVLDAEGVGVALDPGVGDEGVEIYGVAVDAQDDVTSMQTGLVQG